jgi:cobaltochelatase CobS
LGDPALLLIPSFLPDEAKMRVPSYDASELERAIGPRGETIVNSANRAQVQNWLCAQGVPSERAKAMKLNTLWKCYNRPRYLAAVQSHLGGAGADPETLDTVEPLNGAFEPQTSMPAYSDRMLTSPGPAPAIAQTAIAFHEPAPPPSDAGAQLAALIQSLAAGAINEARVLELIAEHAPKPAERVIERIVVAAGAERVTLPDQLRHAAFPEVLACVANAIPVMLVGPAGAGKTTLGFQLAEALGMPFHHIGAVTSRYELSGFCDAQGRYQPTAFRDAYQNGGLFLFDEIDGSDPGALLWCNAAIANGHCAFPDGNIARHEDFRLVAAANTYGRGADRQYVGRNQLDAATLDRFAVIDFDYDESLERAAFGADAWTQRVQAIRAAVASFGGAVRHIVSPRATDYGRRLIAAGMAPERVEQLVIWKGASEADRAKILNAVRER